MMADFVTPRHSAVMERLRRRIELFRQHHNRCESRYDSATQERLEIEKKQTLSLHQRLLQTKAKRASKHRQPQPSGDQAGQRAPGGAESGEGGGTAAELTRNKARMALQETLKRKPDSTSSLANKKLLLDIGSPLDSKPSINDSLNQLHVPTGELEDSVGDLDFHCSKMKREPEDILPIMPPFPDLNEQEWNELIEDLNRSVPIEDIQKILEESLEDRKDSSELALTPGGAGGAAGDGGQLSQSLLPDLASIKTEFPSPSAVFEQDSRTTSPHMKSTSSIPPHSNSSPVATSASSPALPLPQPAPSRPLQPPPNHHLPPVPKDLSPAQQLQQLAAQQQRVKTKMQPQRDAKFLNQQPHPHPPAWPQMTNGPQTSLGVTSSSLYPPDFNPNAQKSLMMPPQPNNGSPKSGTANYMPGSTGHPNILSSLTSGPPLSHPPAQGAQAPTARLTYNNTRPLTHYEVGPGPLRAPNTTSQEKTLLNLVRQPQLSQTTMTFRHHIPHTQDQNSYPAPPRGSGPANVLTSGPGNNPMATSHGVNAMAGNAVYQTNQAVMAAALKQQQQQQQQMLEQQKKKQQYLQRQQLMAEQEMQRQQQEQELQRHRTRPPPKYQDQSGPPANQNPFPQSVSQFTASSQPMNSVGSMVGPTPSSRMFSQNQGMMGITMGQGGGPTVSQADINLPSCSGGGDGAGVDGLYNNMNLHPAHPQQQTGLQRQSLYRQNILPQQHLKPQTSTTLLKQQQLAAAAARLSNTMQGTVGGNMSRSMQMGQNAAWQQQLANQTPTGNAFSNPSNTFHLQQPRIPKMPSGSDPFGTSASGRQMAGLNAGQQMIQTNMAAAQQRAPPTPQSLGQSMANQQQTQQQQANQSLSDLAAFGQPQANGHQGLQCNQGYQVSRTTNQQQVSFGYNVASGSFAAESDLVDSLLKSQSTQEWMADLDELLASHP